MRLALRLCLLLAATVGCGTGSESPFGASDRDSGGRSGRQSAPAAPPGAAPAVTPEARGGGGRKAGRRLASASNAFGFDLFGQLRAAPGNLVFSPASVTLGLVVPWSGAHGDTAAAFAKALHLDGDPVDLLPAWGQLLSTLQQPDRVARVRVANRLYGDKGVAFEAPYLEAVNAAFDAGLEPVDFKGAPEAARADINAWVSDRTEKRIPDLLREGAVTSDTRLVVVNAVYFLARWLHPFEASQTRPAPFHAAGASRDVPTMHQEASFPFTARDGLQALEMPYEGEKLAMLLVLPDAVDGLEDLESSIDAARLDALVAALAPTRVAVAVPRLEIDPAGSLPLKGALESLGLGVAFDRAAADFGGIAGATNPADRLALEDVFHEAFVRVDEAGTEAAAATGATMGVTSLPPPAEAEFRADHPFLFFIRDVGTGLVLFAGRVADPAPPAR